MSINRTRNTPRARSGNRRPATTPEERENQLISQAFDLAEEQIREGTAAAQVITHFLKAGSIRERLEHERIQNENLLLSAKMDAMASVKRIEELYEQAVGVMRTYSGQELQEYDED